VSPRISQQGLLWTSGCFALVLLPHFGGMPAWVLILCGIAAVVRLGLAAGGRDAPPALLRTLIALAAIALLFVQFHTFNGLTAGSALLGLVSGLKLLETRTRRDVCVMILLIYFLSLDALLVGSSFWLLAYLVGVCWLTSATLLRLTVTEPGPTWPASLRYAGRILLQALPLAAMLWLFFPRLTEPLWQLTSNDQGATSGIGDTMSPGDLSDLALSDEIAFRVHFFGLAPPAEHRYWRGPVLDQFDGRVWRRADPDGPAEPGLRTEGPEYRYRISLEAYPHAWIFALDWPTGWDAPHARLTSDGMLVGPVPLTMGLEMIASAQLRRRDPEPLPEAARRRGTALVPATANPRTFALARTLRREHPDERDFVTSVLEMVHSQDFFYTLSPPPLESKDPVDEFLFDTKRGFCGHYASAFAVLMRAAGIPARVVTGYYGGTFNRYSDYWILRQSDAHAWDEIWIDGQGWQRIDPTSAIDPRRVDRRLRDEQAAISLANVDLQSALPWFAALRLRTDALRQLWRERILRYNQDSQQSLLALLHVPDPDAEKLVFLLAATLTACLAWLTWQVRRELAVPPRDTLQRAYAQLCTKLAGVDLPRAAHEGAEAYAQRIAGRRPELADAVGALCRRYNELRYGPQATRDEIAAFARRVRAFRPRGSRAS
jgi:transglutaminase-like putative cysteine protease